MPGAMEHVEGEVFVGHEDHSTVDSCWSPVYDVEGLQKILEKFKGQRASIMVEEIDDE
jgi:hypothetical protein